MKRSGPTPTLLVFTLGAGCEGARRKLLPQPFKATELILHRHGLEAALDAGRRCGFRLVVASRERLDLPDDVQHMPQRGRSFSARLRAAVRSLQASRPGAPLVVVGTDAPDLDARHLEEALDWLARRPDGVVLGPCHDGGFYLLATCRPVDQELAGAKWCRHDTYLSLVEALRLQERPVKRLELLHDLDRYSDVELWLSGESRQESAASLSRLLRSLLAAWRRPPVPLKVTCRLPAQAMTLPARGPPA